MAAGSTAKARRSALAACMAAAGALLMQGCATRPAPPPEPQHPVFRRSAETAPTDLQLLCAGRAAEHYDVAAERVLPLASAVEEGGRYQVLVNAAGTRALCVIDSDGTVLSLADA